MVAERADGEVNLHTVTFKVAKVEVDMIDAIRHKLQLQVTDGRIVTRSEAIRLAIKGHWYREIGRKDGA